MKTHEYGLALVALWLKLLFLSQSGGRSRFGTSTFWKFHPSHRELAPVSTGHSA